MIHTKIFTAVQYLKIDENLDKNLLEGLNLKISNKTSIIESYFDDKNVVRIIGINEINSIKNHGIILYDLDHYDFSWEEFSEYDCLLHFLSLSELFFHALWLVKDNSIQNELGHLIYTNESNFSLHSNYLNAASTTCQGEIKITDFSIEELQLGFYYYNTVLHINIIENKQPKNEAIKLVNTSRLARAFYFLQSARNTNDIGTKISIYCSVFESLFSTSTTELRHRLSEAIAFFLESESSAKIDKYKTVQLAYDIRSSVVHGDTLPSRFLKNNGELLMNVATKTDEVLRRCFIKIIEDAELFDLFTIKSKDDVSSFIQKLIFK